MQSDLAKEKLDPNIKFQFAKGGGNIVYKGLVSNKKTNNVGRDTETNCQRAFISALLAFQDSAKATGATKVVNLVSYYKLNEFKSATEFQCANGNIIAGVALKGDIAK